MGLFSRAKTVSTHTSEPYAYEPGMKYLLEVDTRAVSLPQIQELQAWFVEQGIICKIIASQNGIRALHPVTAEKTTSVYRSA